MKELIWYTYKNRIEKHYYHDGEQQLSFYKKVYIKTYKLSKKKDILVMFSFYIHCGTKMYCKKGSIPIWQKPYSRQFQMPYSTWKKLTYMDCNWSDKLQVTPFFICFPFKKIYLYTFKASLEEVIVMSSEKMKAKYIKGKV